MQQGHTVSNRAYSQPAHLQLPERLDHSCKPLDGELPQTVLLHTEGVIYGNVDVVVPGGHLGSSEPDLVLEEVGSDVGDHLFEV